MSLTNPPTPADPAKLYNLADQVLGVCEDILTDAGLALPPMTFVYGGASPPGMCDTMAVGWARVGHGTPTGMDQPMPIKGQMSPRRAWLAIWVFRCLSDVLTGEGEEMRAAAVNPDAAAADAQTIMSDAYTLHKGLVIAHAAGSIGRDGMSPIVVEDFVPLTNSGGVGGCRGGLIYELV